MKKIEWVLISVLMVLWYGGFVVGYFSIDRENPTTQELLVVTFYFLVGSGFAVYILFKLSQVIKQLNRELENND